MDRQRRTAVILLVITAVLWSTGGLLIKMVSWSPPAIAGGRSLIAALLMLAVIRRPKARFTADMVIASLAYAGTVLCFVAANKLTTAANAILLQYTAPVFVALLGAKLLKERAGKADWAAIAAVLAGMVLFFLDDLGGGRWIGNLIGILSGIFFALFTVFMRRQKDGNPIESCFWGNIVTAAIGLPFILREGVPGTADLAGILLLGLFQLGLSYILYSRAIRHVTALDAILIPVIEPLLNPVFVMIAFGEFPGPFSAIGGAVILAAVIFRSLSAVYGRGQSKPATDFGNVDFPR